MNKQLSLIAARLAGVVNLLQHRTRLRVLKTVADVVTEYEIRLSQYVVDVLNGDATAGELARGMRALIRRKGAEAYIEGMADGGIDDPESELTDEDEAAISEWIDSQLEHVAAFADAVKAEAARPVDDDTEARQRVILARMDLWVQSLRDIGGKGKASALKNMMVTWRYGDTDHCTTCQSLNGKRRRLSWFTSRGYYPQEKGSSVLDCGGWNCQCELRDDKGKVVLPA